MKRYSKFTRVLLFVFILTGCVSNRLAGFRSLSTTPHGYAIVSDVVRAGKEAQRFEVRAGDCGADEGWSDCDNDRERSEISVSKRFYPNADQWIAFSVYLPKDYQTSNFVNTTIGQIHQKGGDRPTGSAGGLPSFPPLLQLEVKGDRYRACIHILTGPVSNVKDRCKYFYLSSVTEMRGRWTDIEMHFDTTDQKSLIEIYVNKDRKARLENFVNFWPERYYVKYGIYRSFVSRHPGPMPTQIAWIDEVKMGKTREAVSVNALNPVD